MYVLHMYGCVQLLVSLFYEWVENGIRKGKFRNDFGESETFYRNKFSRATSPLRPLPFNVSGNLEFRAVKFYFRIPFNHLYQELFGTENPDFPAGKSGIPGPTFEGSKVGPRYVRAVLPKVTGTPTVESM